MEVKYFQIVLSRFIFNMFKSCGNKKMEKIYIIEMGADYFLVFILLSISTTLKIKRDSNQQDLKIVNLHFDNSE